MAGITRVARVGALAFKLVAVGLGLFAILISIDYVLNEYTYLGTVGSLSFRDIVTIIAILSVTLSGMALVTALPSSIRVRFPKRPRGVDHSKPIYGFSSLLAIGLGATLGSPLFILIPLNIVQFEFVSLGSLLLATILSILMARVYSDMYTESTKLGLDAIGGPSFTKVACGKRSVRYFVARLSMWIANTALAAYSKIVFVIFDFELMPGILANFGIQGADSQIIVYTITGVFIAWTVINALFEQRFLRFIGRLQIILTVVMVGILLVQSLLLGRAGSWNLSGIMQTGSGGNWPFALVVNTAYLYLLFFGFQEIQALERDAVERSSIPIVSWIRKGYTMSKFAYLGAAMIASVVIAAVINILYGLAVFSLHPNYDTLLKSQIPALYLANAYLGPTQELLTAVAFLTATITTFVPAFLAASRHLSALAEDGFMPLSVSKLSYVFTLGSILILAVGDQNFLIAVTDFLVLISLGVISLSSIWLRKREGAASSDSRSVILPLIVGASCFVAGAAIYFVSASVAIFGSVSLAIVYLMYDIYELGWLGSQLFLGVLDGVVYLLLLLYPHHYSTLPYFIFQWLGIPSFDTSALSFFLLLSALFIFVNLSVDAYLRKKIRTGVALVVS
ncbi:MAG TPA: hypothetical protein VFF30_09615 [Nitrososphaerales archaeon]|nr:hypothetical protein [Nitrososphaerales archaeon]